MGNVSCTQMRGYCQFPFTNVGDRTQWLCNANRSPQAFQGWYCKKVICVELGEVGWEVWSEGFESNLDADDYVDRAGEIGITLLGLWMWQCAWNYNPQLSAPFRSCFSQTSIHGILFASKEKRETTGFSTVRFLVYVMSFLLFLVFLGKNVSSSAIRGSR